MAVGPAGRGVEGWLQWRAWLVNVSTIHSQRAPVIRVPFVHTVHSTSHGSGAAPGTRAARRPIAGDNARWGWSSSWTACGGEYTQRMWTDYRAAHLAERRGTVMLLHGDARRHYPGHRRSPKKSQRDRRCRDLVLLSIVSQGKSLRLRSAAANTIANVNTHGKRERKRVKSRP